MFGCRAELITVKRSHCCTIIKLRVLFEFCDNIENLKPETMFYKKVSFFLHLLDGRCNIVNFVYWSRT